MKDGGRPGTAVVVGGGVIGLCTARELALAGLEVTVVEAGECGGGASKGNGGWVTPSLSGPLAAPGAMRSGLAWMFRRDSPFTIRPRAERGELAWYWNFWRSCAEPRFRAGLRAMLALNASTFADYDQMRDDGVEFEMHDKGLVYAALSSRGLHHAELLATTLRESGYDGVGDILDGDELRAVEPSLSEAVRGGFVAAHDRYVRPESLVRGLVQWLRGSQVRIEEGFEVERVETSAADSWRIRTSDGRSVTAERLVVAAGPSTLTILADQVGSRLRLMPAKGYSITARGSGQVPQCAIYMLEAKVSCSPFDDSLRLAGTLELGAGNTKIAPRRMSAIEASAEGYLASWRPREDREVWAGLRTLTPDGLPLIGGVPGHSGLYVATGHGMLGVTLAPSTATHIRSLVVEGRPALELEPFKLERWVGRG